MEYSSRENVSDIIRSSIIKLLLEDKNKKKHYIDYSYYIIQNLSDNKILPDRDIMKHHLPTIYKKLFSMEKWISQYFYKKEPEFLFLIKSNLSTELHEVDRLYKSSDDITKKFFSEGLIADNKKRPNNKEASYINRFSGK